MTDCQCCANRVCLDATDAVILEGAARVHYAEVTRGVRAVARPGRPPKVEPRDDPVLERALRAFRRQKLKLMGKPMHGAEADAYANSPL